MKKYEAPEIEKLTFITETVTSGQVGGGGEDEAVSNDFNEDDY